MTRRVPGMPGEYHDWLDDVEPAWTILDPARFEALMGEPSSAGGPLRLAVDLTDGEVVNCAIVRNALVLLRAASEGDGLKLTVRGNLAPRRGLGHARGDGMARLRVRREVACRKAVERAACRGTAPG